MARMSRAARIRGASITLAAATLLIFPGTAAASPWALRMQQPQPTGAIVPAPRQPAPTSADPQPATTPTTSDPTSTQPAAPTPRPAPPPPLPPPYAQAYGPQPVWAAPRVRVERDEREPDGGGGHIAGGVILMVVGAAMIGGGAAIIVNNKSAFESDTIGEGFDNGAARIGGAVLAILGVGPTIGGIALTIIGASKAARHREWQQRQLRRQQSANLAPNLARTGLGTWTVGMRLAF